MKEGMKERKTEWQRRKTVKEIKKVTEGQTYHRSGSSERSGVGDQASQGVLLTRSVDYMSIVRHHDGHLLHHLDSSCPQQQGGGEDEEEQGGGGGNVAEKEKECS